MHLYENSELNWHLENGVDLKVTQKTNYPWDGGVEITVAPTEPSDFTLYLRIPGRAEHAQVAGLLEGADGCDTGTIPTDSPPLGRR